MNAKEYLESKGVFGLDTKKRYNEVIGWMEGYAQEIVKNCSIPDVSNLLSCDGCKYDNTTNYDLCRTCGYTYKNKVT